MFFIFKVVAVMLVISLSFSSAADKTLTFDGTSVTILGQSGKMRVFMTNTANTTSPISGSTNVTTITTTTNSTTTVEIGSLSEVNTEGEKVSICACVVLDVYSYVCLSNSH